MELPDAGSLRTEIDKALAAQNYSTACSLLETQSVLGDLLNPTDETAKTSAKQGLKLLQHQLEKTKNLPRTDELSEYLQLASLATDLYGSGLKMEGKNGSAAYFHEASKISIHVYRKLEAYGSPKS